MSQNLPNEENPKIVRLVTKPERVEKDIRYVFKEVSDRINGDDEDFKNFNKAMIVLLDDRGEEKYEYTIISANLHNAEAISLMEIVKTEAIKNM